MDFESLIKEELTEARNVLDQFIKEPAMLEKINQSAGAIALAIKSGHKVISCGNGGSHCDAMHFAEELSGRYRHNRKALPAIAISDPSHITCVGNDYGFESIFSRYVEGIGQKGDVLLGITTSGNSKNIIKALQVAREKGMITIILSGKDGGEAAQLADYSIIVPHSGFSDRIQEIHIKIIHIFILIIEKILT
ncbi:MAG: D-sedoheptulose 7-phosphate isomerase [Cyclobacteriaceae bacterium]|nr:D-sedoheptulose 7-phosphate isomerase [Cyclobacteriaceae bacterium]